MKIGVAGCGGIGSNVARNLVQAGIKNFKLIDFDHVEVANLNRQFYQVSQAGKKKTDCLEQNLRAINPDLAIEKIDQKIMPGDSPGLFADCDIIVEGFDTKESKKMIMEEMAQTGKTLVSASGIAGFAMETVQIRRIGNAFVVGDFSSDQDRFDLFAPKIIMVAAMMAGIVLNMKQRQIVP
ncbi:MAG: sulfur carrier protein ThiS adenylyltransferase ThiF [Desulfobacteraceae bacterium]|nr:sulfur carrier protein ThiS adenylyltransferase ThiF [Desulfobacteraceae bacterium]